MEWTRDPFNGFKCKLGIVELVVWRSGDDWHGEIVRDGGDVGELRDVLDFGDPFDSEQAAKDDVVSRAKLLFAEMLTKLAEYHTPFHRVGSRPLTR